MKYNDLDIENWKDCNINTDSLWLISERDKSGKHENIYHGNFVPQIPNQLIRRYTKKGETVFEPFMGSGTTLFECEKLSRKHIGFKLMNNEKDLTYSEAIEQVMRNNGYFAPLKLLYKEIWNYKDRSKIIGKTPDFTIQERVQRDPRFTRIAKGVYALTEFLEQVEKEDLGFFTVEKNEVVFKEAKKFVKTENIVQQKVRIGQSYFRAKLLSEMKSCPITGIDDKRLLIASHIKPWVHSNNEERVNTKNGILLSPLFDKLFDKGIGLITFTLEKKILISNKISPENIARLNISHNQTLENFDITGREEFLEYHRKFIFQG